MASRIVTPSIASAARVRLERIFATKEREIEELADHVRETVIVPACERYGLEYVSGMGTFFFTDPKVNFHTHARGQIATKEHAADARLPALVKVFEILDQEVDNEAHALLGHYVGDVRFAEVR